MRSFIVVATATALLLGCDPAGSLDAGVDAGPVVCDAPPFERGDDGDPDPLASLVSGEARAGRAPVGALPDYDNGLQMWEAGDFLLANEHVAMVIEDVGASDLYDPWGGRPVGLALPVPLADGYALDAPADFGEILLLMSSQTVLTEHVSVLNDGRDGAAAVIRAEGVPRPMPFFHGIVGSFLQADFSGHRAVIDYVLEPGARYVDVYYELRSDGPTARSTTQMHAFMHTPRMPPFGPGVGFAIEGASMPWVGFADPDGASFAYLSPEADLGGGLEISGFVSFFTRGFATSCAPTRRHHARVIIGGPGAGVLVGAVLETLGEASREVTGVVRDASGAAVADAWVLASGPAGFLSRTRTGADGSYLLTLPAAAEAELIAFRQGDRIGPAVPADGATVDLVLPEGGWVHVVVTDMDSGAPLPVRVQIFPTGGASAPRPAGHFGVPSIVAGRLQVAYPSDGDVTLRAPAETVRIVVSRGYEYEIVDREVTLTEGAIEEIAVSLERVIDTVGVQCGDFHIHTHRSNDSGDDARMKLLSAVADGVELPVRTEHEYIASFAPLIEELGLSAFAYGVGSIEMTSFETWGHMGVVPLTPLPDEVNAGAPRWQSYPTVGSPDTPVEAFTPVEVFDAVRARPEAPTVIINHPRGDPNYFDYVGFDPVTGEVALPEAWDDEFTLVEVFNDSDWIARRDREVRDWLALLDSGRRVFAVGSSDSHRISSSPVGYPRTCLALGVDDPSALDPETVRDALAGGHGTISGGIYVDTWAGPGRPGDEVIGLGATTEIRVRVQAASWVDVDSFDVVVDGATVERIDILPTDADPLEPTIRLDRMVTVDVASAGSYVIVAAYGDADLEPVHPRRTPFGVSNPIFLRR